MTALWYRRLSDLQDDRRIANLITLTQARYLSGRWFQAPAWVLQHPHLRVENVKTSENECTKRDGQQEENLHYREIETACYQGYSHDESYSYVTW